MLSRAGAGGGPGTGAAPDRFAGGKAGASRGLAASMNSNGSNSSGITALRVLAAPAARGGAAGAAGAAGVGEVAGARGGGKPGALQGAASPGAGAGGSSPVTPKVNSHLEELRLMAASPKPEKRRTAGDRPDLGSKW
ncbi:hypothetical protein MNEG_16406 [Monoraphidium neglectum]|uniref:Uncharacterized protein n=1 Tax=Monoraphidium neglectum TaxID=145388 RepID=A0A0D2IUD7_9CHLO|nr:hypothetical protein MNEG_16406 [Monoraphidium neglectum]KIY91557.1 hypothetical protein MNEG_16406 [Monoraphidium neglectum]|eukprot:XP_013890577.1 hypothetical protein MNEG_16406 [Monoraphidium neglectum]